MDFNSFYSDIISGVSAAAIVAAISYFWGFKPLKKKVKKLEEKMISYNSQTIDEIYKIYEERIEDYKAERKDLITKRTNCFNERHEDKLITEEQYYDAITYEENCRIRIEEINEQLDSIVSIISDKFSLK